MDQWNSRTGRDHLLRDSRRCANSSVKWLAITSIALITLLAVGQVRAITLPVSQDAWVRANLAPVQGGERLRLALNRDVIERQTYLKFSLATLPAGIDSADIEKVTLRIWVDDVRRGGAADSHLGDWPVLGGHTTSCLTLRA